MAGLYVTVSDIVEIRDALLIEIGARYGPPAILNSVPAGVMMTCAGVTPEGGVPGAAGNGWFGSRGGVTGAIPVVAGGVVAPAGGVVATGGTTPAGGGVPG